ncbi:MAG: hypothetical protein MK213_09855, partial [Planctomycetes bacterium]|nr:hypothetical protein [Planctomycetota bacterium]
MIDGTLDVSGQAAPSNLGKYFARTTEVIPGESTGGVFDFEAQGGSAGNGSLSGGSGGAGGFSWYLLDGIWGAFQDPDFLDETKNGFTSGMPDATRYFFGISWPQVHGKNGQGVGGVLPTGRPIGLPGDADAILADWEGGSGMGSWAWPPVSLQFPDDISDVTNQSGTPIRSHRDGLGGFLEHALHRSRGGGGGGFWTAGERGGAFDASSSDPLLNTLLTPEVDVVAGVFEFNDDLLLWDANAAGGGQVQDAAGGGYNLPAGIETLSPELGFLLGGAGGGGAGASMHGSYDDDPATGPLDPDGVLDTIRTCSGAGGGAGGGALQLEAGGRISVSGTINVSGGNGGDSRFMLNSLLFPPTVYDDPFAILYGQPGDAGGGGGSGGSLLMRNSGLLQVTSESIQLSGGRGGVGSAGNHGGDGGAGVARFETASGSESLATLQAMVTPDQSIELSPIGSPGVPNIGSYSGISPGTTGDLSGFSGNASGVRSRWFTPQNSVL